MAAAQPTNRCCVPCCAGTAHLMSSPPAARHIHVALGITEVDVSEMDRWSRWRATQTGIINCDGSGAVIGSGNDVLVSRSFRRNGAMLK